MTRIRGTKLARLYRRKTRSGKPYLEGKMTEVSRLVIIENDRKESPKDPDFYAYVVPNRGPLAIEEEPDASPEGE